MTYRVAIFIFNEVEVLDFAGPFEVFSVAGLRTMNVPPFEVFTVAQFDTINARNHLTIKPTYTLEKAPKAEIIVIPGGGGFHADGTPFGSRREMNNPIVLKWIQEQSAQAKLTLSVCTGSLILAKAGLLEGKEATTHFLAIDALKKISETISVKEKTRLVDNGNIMTSEGVSAGIDMSLYVVSKLLGKETADETARYMQYDYWK
ncbi:DJ-1/PfpI family protein [Lacibacter sp. MH-610]|uniref:DJ-1/PfpI family protein n=1 Tax=Lacibacter sp. MH-610 TaxID=3020883 RepID=UPI003892133B